MPLFLVLIPVITAYIFYIPYIIKGGLASLRLPRPHIVAAVSVLVSTVALMLLFMDFAAPMSFSPLKLLAVVICSVGFCACVTLASFINKKRGTLFALALAMLVAVLLEGTAFNYKFWQTHDYTPTDITQTMSVSSAFAPSESDPQYLKFESSASI